MKRPFLGWLAVILVAAAGTSSAAHSGQPESDAGAIRRLWSARPCELRAGIVSLHARGKDAIPALIDAIEDSTPRWPSPLRHPYLDIIAPKPTFLAGELPAYVVELILSKETLETRANPDCQQVLEVDDYPYRFGEVWSKAPSKNQVRLPDLQGAYRLWWRRSAGKPLAVLREEWHAGRGPLAGTRLEWR
jgi:hypothetical protein